MTLIDIVEKIRDDYDNKTFLCSVFIDLEKHLTQLIIKYLCKNYTSTVSWEPIITGSVPILAIENSASNLTPKFRRIGASPVEFHRDQFWGPFCF